MDGLQAALAAMTGQSDDEIAAFKEAVMASVVKASDGTVALNDILDILFLTDPVAAAKAQQTAEDYAIAANQAEVSRLEAVALEADRVAAASKVEEAAAYVAQLSAQLAAKKAARKAARLQRLLDAANAASTTSTTTTTTTTTTPSFFLKSASLVGATFISTLGADQFVAGDRIVIGEGATAEISTVVGKLPTVDLLIVEELQHAHAAGTIIVFGSNRARRASPTNPTSSAETVGITTNRTNMLLYWIAAALSCCMAL
jgi:hypothetical protein